MRWIPPPQGWVKINVDGAFSTESCKGGIEVVIRDSEGQVLLSSWRVIFKADSAEEVEALACKEGVQLAGEWVHMSAILETV
ncbi:hypothetical protein PR202_ga20593 [Eleusine coracana subsp. coracana]|uniref:RNase H type-1 domain-containing protein n=1 Tax=Eleusine coracana subsp. coracana TaxID=191504 RepID=A0AAV5CYP4_ELECO|nr:hypothetical protein PR202_ga20593 [Eleusine coracana subsp. coracana]